MKSTPCDLCKNDPVRRSGRKHKGMYVCATCRGTDRFLRLPEPGA